MDSQLKNSEVSVSAVVVVYNDYHSLGVLIESLHHLVDVVAIVDNSDIKHSVPEAILNYINVIYHKMDRNEGLGAGLNAGIQVQEIQQSDWVLLLDQDSIVTDNIILCMLDEYSRCSEREKIGLICPDVFLPDKDGHQFPIHFGKLFPSKVTKTSDAVDFAITSGSMVKLSVFEAIGYLNEVFFIDYIDYDFCLRLRAHGYKILYAREAVLAHRLGERKVSNTGIKYTAHAPARIYYQTRNRLILVRRYGVRFPAFALMQSLLFVLKFFKILVIEDQKVTRLRYYFTGMLHSFQKRYYLS